MGNRQVLIAMKATDQKHNPYSQYEKWKRWNEYEFGSYNRKEHYYFKQLIAPFLKVVEPEGVTVLEIGYGNGALAGWLKTTHPNVSWMGIEIQESLVEKANTAGFSADKAIPAPTDQDQFDLIVALDVIEHFSDIEIAAFFSDVAPLLKPTGAIVTRTPNAAGPFGLPNQTGDPTHITPVSVSRLASYLSDWQIEERGDILPIWEGRPLSACRNCIKLALRAFIVGIIRFAFAPQPKTLLSSNLHLAFKPKD